MSKLIEDNLLKFFSIVLTDVFWVNDKMLQRLSKCMINALHVYINETGYDL